MKRRGIISHHFVIVGILLTSSIFRQIPNNSGFREGLLPELNPRDDFLESDDTFRRINLPKSH